MACWLDYPDHATSLTNSICASTVRFILGKFSIFFKMKNEKIFFFLKWLDVFTCR